MVFFELVVALLNELVNLGGRAVSGVEKDEGPGAFSLRDKLQNALDVDLSHLLLLLLTYC